MLTGARTRNTIGSGQCMMATPMKPRMAIAGGQPNRLNSGAAILATMANTATDGAKLVVTVLSEVADATAETQQSAQTVLAASESVEEAAANLRGEFEDFLAKVAV